MDITAVRVIRPKDRTSPVLCFADISIDSGVQLRDARLLRPREEGGKPLLRMPSQQNKNGAFRDVYNPIVNEAREQMTAAVMAALKEAEEADKNDYTATFEPSTKLPEFSSIRIRRLDDDRPVKAFVSCIMDNAVALNRMAIVLDDATKMLRVSMPNHNIVRTGGFASYYRMQKQEYSLLYNAIMKAYTESENEDAASGAAEDAEETAAS